MKKLEFKEISESEYQELEKLAPVDFVQSSAMSRVQASLGFKNHFFAGFESIKATSNEARNEAKALLIANLTSVNIFGGLKYQMKYGPSFLENDGAFNQEYFEAFLEFLKAYVKQHQGILLKVTPNLDYQHFDDKGEPIDQANEAFMKKMQADGMQAASPWLGYDEGEPVWHYVKDLSAITDEKSLLKSYSRDGQYSVKLTKQFGISIRQLSYEELPEFKKITEATSERRGYDDRDMAYFQAFYKEFADAAKYLVAEINFQTYVDSLKHKIADLEDKISKSTSAKKQKQREEWQSQIGSQEKRIKQVQPFLDKYQDQSVILAGSLFVDSGDEMVYLFSGSYEEFKPFYGPFAIQHYVMTDAINRGFKRYNFYGVSGVQDGTDGVLHFKQNFAGYSVKKVGSFTYSPNPLKYKLIQLVKGILRRN